eukprot:TRINITY_DN14835_c0_g1_i3.p1 TRINITY_DN14835_c0_g1~~TRINITY_DN14835_c0_g1_i3.p1  ORF type:complete len:571 (+),score=62.55 TRINITY_DN14835_c0_g1_i3:99-1811(+)
MLNIAPQGNYLAAVYCLCYVVQLYVLKWTWLASFSKRLLLLGANKLAESVRWCTRGRFIQKDYQPDERDDVTQKMLEWQYSFVLVALASCQFCLGMMGFVTIATVVNGQKRLYTSYFEDAAVTVSYASVLILQLIADRLGKSPRKRTTLLLAAAFYTVHAFSISVLILGSSTKEDVRRQDITILAVRVIMAALIFERRWVLLCSLVYGMVFVVKAYMLGFPISWSIPQQFACCGICLASCVTCRTCCSLQVQKNCDAQQMLEAAQRLLDLLCDAVVRLNGDYKIDRNSPKLSGLLNLSPGRSLAEMRLEDFLEASCKDTLRQALQTTSDTSASGHGESAAGAVNLRMVDAFGNILPMQAFYICFRNLAQKAYLVGLREMDRGPDTMGHFTELAPENLNAANAGHPAPAMLGSSQSSFHLSEHTGVSTDTDGAFRPALLHRFATSARAVEEKLQDVARSINHIKPLIGCCCPYHESIESLMFHLDRLRRLGCQSEYPLYESWQCKTCGIMQRMGAADNVCSGCRANMPYSCAHMVAGSPQSGVIPVIRSVPEGSHSSSTTSFPSSCTSTDL